MWVSSWNGIYSYDGYEFVNHKPRISDSVVLTNNRIDEIKEDIYGNIWMCNYDRKLYRYSLVNDRYSTITSDINYAVDRFYPLSDGSIYIMLKNKKTLYIKDSNSETCHAIDIKQI